MADGDGRYLLGMVEQVLAAQEAATRSGSIEGLLPGSPVRQVARGALQPHLRPAQADARFDPDAALYWLARMLTGSEDPLYVLRRLVRFASEDVIWPTRPPSSMTLAA